MIVTGVASPRARVTAGDEHALFEIGSVTKAFTGVLLADLVLAGELRLEDPLAAHLPAGAPLPRWEGAGPTLLDLITHHAGLPNVPTGFLRGELALAVGLPGARDPWRDADDQAFQRAVAATRVRGTGRFRYSSLGVGLLGRALEHRTGTKFETLLRERLLRPLELEETWVDVPAAARGRLLTGSTARGWPQPPLDDAIPAAGGLRSSAGDVLRFLEASSTRRRRRPARHLRSRARRSDGSAAASKSRSAGSCRARSSGTTGGPTASAAGRASTSAGVVPQ